MPRGSHIFLTHTDDASKSISLIDYIDAVDQVFSDDIEMPIQTTLELGLDGMFDEYSLKVNAINVLELIGMKKKIKLNKKNKNKLVKKFLSGDLKELYPLLQKYILGKWNQEQRAIIEEIISKCPPISLKSLTNMDEDLCVMLIRMNPNFILSDDIWELSRDFQVMMLYTRGYIDDKAILSELMKKIVFISKEDIVFECYEVFRESLYEIIMGILFDISDKDVNKMEKWLLVFSDNPEIILNRINNIASDIMCEKLFIMINKRDKAMINKVLADNWNILYKRIICSEKKQANKKGLLLDFIMIVLNFDNKLDVDIVDEIVRPLYQSLLKNELSTGDWNSFQFLLPQIEPCYSWDKCRRIREALTIRGYFLKDINLD